MRLRPFCIVIVVALAVAISACAKAAPAAACGGVQIEDGWVRAAPPGAGMMAGYLRFTNRSAAEQVIRGVSSPQFGGVEMHETLHEGGMMQMRALAPLRLPAGGTVAFEPGGKHLMLMQPAGALRTGDTVSLRFDCDPQAALSAELPVKQAP